jgi:predicted esterase
MLVHVPLGFASGTQKRFPLVVLLHGYEGTPESVLRAFLGGQRDGPHPALDGFIVAPQAYGNSFYRGPGEHDVLDAVDWMIAHYPIDDRRVSITGVSMGGTGVAHLALRYPERFSAAASLCGYHSYFLRRDTADRPLRPWEIRQMHHWSPASWAANGRHLPLFVAQGTRDWPLSNSRVLVDAYRTLGYSVRTEWPDTGHAVWEQVYANQRLWPWLTQARRAPAPARVSLTTDGLRYGAQDWLRVTALDASDGLVQLDAERLSAERVLVTARKVTGFELDRSRAGLGSGTVVIQVDHDSLSFGPNEPLAAHLDPVGWRAGAPARSQADKRAGLEGPLDDAWLEPLVFVYGTLDPRWTRANREVAESLARLRNGVQVRYPILSDREFDPGMAADHSLVLVGHRDNHALIRRLDSRLPIGVAGEAIRIGKRTYAGKDLGTTFIYPNPEHRNRYLVLVEGAGIPGLYYALSLPQLLPDLLLYDAAVAPAAGQQVLGRAHVLAAGYFQSDWSLPAQLDDPLRP